MRSRAARSLKAGLISDKEVKSIIYAPFTDLTRGVLPGLRCHLGHYVSLATSSAVEGHVHAKASGTDHRSEGNADTGEFLNGPSRRYVL